MPTEAEWEKAAKGENNNLFPWGISTPDPNLANIAPFIGKPTEVGSYPAGASPYGVLDMAGNVYEWVYDYYSPTYYDISRKDNPPGPISGYDRGDLFQEFEGDVRVIRGGAFNQSQFTARTTFRLWGGATGTTDYIGFRCAYSE